MLNTKNKLQYLRFNHYVLYFVFLAVLVKLVQAAELLPLAIPVEEALLLPSPQLIQLFQLIIMEVKHRLDQHHLLL
jgi:uncharacterized metal-binding protein